MHYVSSPCSCFLIFINTFGLASMVGVGTSIPSKQRANTFLACGEATSKAKGYLQSCEMQAGGGRNNDFHSLTDAQHPKLRS